MEALVSDDVLDKAFRKARTSNSYELAVAD
jgi:hypothetical protein